MSIFRKQGVYWIDYYVDGRRKRERIGSSRKLAHEVLHKRKAEIAEGRFFPERRQKSITFREMADKYWRLRGQYFRSNSWRYMLPKIVQALGTNPLRNISVADLQEFYNQMREQTSVANANRYMTLISSIFNCAAEWGDYSGKNPTSKIKDKRGEKRRLRYLSKEEITLLLSGCNLRIYPAVMCALLTGMRKGEILGLTWENVNLEHGVIYILQSKSGKPREIPIPPKLRSVFLGLQVKKEGRVFEIPEITLRREFTKAVRDAGIRDFRFHDLRHTFASHFIMSTSNLPVLQQILGHASAAMTQRYAHLAKSHLVAEMTTFDSSMPAAQPNISGNGHLLQIPST
ncbi:MAG: site-specific integrase [bacterium]